jgi:hypothetical protein
MEKKRRKGRVSNAPGNFAGRQVLITRVARLKFAKPPAKWVKEKN